MHGLHSSRPDRPNRSEPKRASSSSGKNHLDESDAGTNCERPPPPSGLCVTCIHERDCTFPRRESQPVLFCEEFDGYVKGTSSAAVKAGPPPCTGHAEGMHGSEHSSEFKGLCATCEKRDVCTFPKAEGGIWHCEEFE